MAKLSIIGLISMAFVTVPSPIRAEPAGDVRTLILFGASWCAPCIAELRKIGPLAAAMPGIRIVVAWNDAGIGSLRFDRPSTMEVVSVQRAQQLRLAYASGIAGYPYAVMLDAQGHACSRRGRAVTGEVIDAMRGECSRNSP